MASKRRKNDKKASWWRVALHYIFLWPSLRLYYTIIRGFNVKKKEKKEKVVIIQER
jgi:hypothetical protein